jgi:type II secretory pathway component GspD/PulD (secretin)
MRLTTLLILLLAAVATAAQDDAPVNKGDTLFVEVYRRPELSSTVTVDESGNIQVPYVGSVNVGGTTEKEASERVANSLLAILKNPKVTVSHSAARPAAAARSTEMVTQVIALTNSNAEALGKSLQGMSTPGGSIAYDANSNSIIVTDTPSTLHNILGVINQIDQMKSQVTQVRIQTKVAEVKQGAMKELGVRWFASGNDVTGGYYPPLPQELSTQSHSQDPLANERIGGSDGGQGSGLNRRFVDEPKFDRRLNVPVQVPLMGQMFFGLMNEHVDIGAILDALVKDNQAELLATPWITTVNHKQAEIKMTDEFPYTESSQSFGTTNFTIKFMDLGIKMLVTPHVYKDTSGQYVQMELKPEVSFPTGNANGIPIRAVRSSDSIANVRDGQTLVIGGIVLNDEHKVDQAVPGLGKLPVMGNLFKRKEQAKTRNELMIFVTPSIHEQPETITWDRMINLTGSAKSEIPTAPPALGEARKE